MTDPIFTPLADLQRQDADLEREHRELVIKHGNRPLDSVIKGRLHDIALTREQLRVLIAETVRVSNDTELQTAIVAESKKRASHRARVRTVADGMSKQLAAMESHLHAALALAEEISTTGRHQAEHLASSATAVYSASDAGLDRSMVALPAAVGASDAIGRALVQWFAKLVEVGGWQHAVSAHCILNRMSIGHDPYNPRAIAEAAERDVKVVRSHVQTIESQETQS